MLFGVVLTGFFIAWYSGYRKGRQADAERGGEEKWSAGWFSTFSKSDSSPAEKLLASPSRGPLDRFRDAFGRRGELRPQDAYQTKLPPRSTDTISPPPPAAPNHIPRYPSILERTHSQTARHPPPLQELSRVPSMTESLRSAPAGDRVSRRKVQIPPRALLLPPRGRPLPGLAGALRSPKSPLKPKTWFSKRLSKHPFIPLRDDSSLQFPPSPRTPDRYQPSRQHLEARSRTSGEMQNREPVRRQPIPLFVEDGQTTMYDEGLQTGGLKSALRMQPSSSTIRTPLRTAVPKTSNGVRTPVRTPVQPMSSKLALNSASYI